MELRSGIIARAFELAGQFSNVEQIRVQLRKEGYNQVDAHLAGAKIRSDLRKVMSGNG